eukprot:TRINITY_DN929_c0_g10_i1.p2 TRINITY_DN929_c0_g10~~TRINITY_DN929_c0_g10_i1.p2  ORF type:complete len:324 (+),score=135.90 TRINITY_DN929_c0_g10_i1:59-973(+)
MPHEVCGFNVGSKIGRGVSGEVYRGCHPKTGENVAIKIAPLGDYMMESEACVYRSLHQRRRMMARAGEAEEAKKNEVAVRRGSTPEGFPRMYYFGHVKGKMVMVLDYLDQNLEGLMRAERGRMSWLQILRMGRSVLARLQILHEQGFIHRDIKPENIMFKTSNQKVYLIDFGLCKRYVDPITGQHISEGGEATFSGSPCFASVHAHQGAQSRRDDIISLLYVLIYLMKGSLPWLKLTAGLDITDECLLSLARSKRDTDRAELCEGVPRVIEEMLAYTDGLSFTEEPDYDLLDKMFTGAMMPPRL